MRNYVVMSSCVSFIKLACESQLTEILFKLIIIIKLACESQLTEILFKLIIIINGACHLNGKAHYCYCSYLLFFFFHFYFGALLLPQFLSQSHE